MCPRQERQRAIGFEVVLEDFLGTEDVGDDVGVREFDSFGLTGGAGGVDDGGDVVGTDVGSDGGSGDGLGGYYIIVSGGLVMIILTVMIRIVIVIFVIVMVIK